VYLDDQVGLGHARLSIIDLTSGVQPIHNEDKTLWIIYNGEVFNYPELAEGLQRKGHRFYTTSDTEVILHLYEDEGPECLARLNGQWAMAIWDAKKKELFLSRDRIGIRPLYYAILDDTLFFGSEIKSIFANENVSREIDPVAMDQIFTFWTTLTPRTVFKDIYELPPGHYLKILGYSFVSAHRAVGPRSARNLRTNPGPARRCGSDSAARRCAGGLLSQRRVRFVGSHSSGREEFQ
ncbi:MAG: asparagine synthetase B family protein, partial [Planctomycetota bacterium]|jgi:asparagine synthase (glutamine-hydrolysing)